MSEVRKLPCPAFGRSPPRGFGRVRRILAVFSALLPLFAGAASAQESLATAWRMAPREGGHRFVLDLTEKVSFQVFSLVDPDRIVVDLTPVAWRLDTAEPIGPVRALRTGRLQPGVGRLVLDLAQPARVTASRLVEPRDGQKWRLILDIEPVRRDAFVSAAGPPGPTAGVQVGGPTLGAQQTSLRAPPVVKPEPKRLPVIVIDPGHGGKDPGAISVSHVYEKAITLEAGLELRRQLQATGRYRVLMTRADDRFVVLRDRVAFARSVQADLFISIHADSIGNPNHRGLTVYTVSDTASDRESEALAQKENKADVIAGVDLGAETKQVATILIALTQRETKNKSARFAGLAVEQLSKLSRTVDQAHRFAGFAVLTAPDVPSVLIELGYLSNRDDERELQSPAYRKKMAERITNAIDLYFAPPSAVAVASAARAVGRRP